jgi:hypothetical protein
VAAYPRILPSGRRVSIPELSGVTDLSGRVDYQLNRFVASLGQFPAVGASSGLAGLCVTPAFVRANGITRRRWMLRC